MRPPQRPYPLGLVLEACPDIADYARNGISSWRDLVATAATVRSIIGSSPSAWEDANTVLGLEDPAVLVAAIVQSGTAIHGWPSSPHLIVPENIVLMRLPPYAPELNSVENIWDYLRSNFLSHCVWDTREAIRDACCDAWNALIAKSEVIASMATRDWAQVKI